MVYEDPMIKVIEKRIEAIELIVSSLQKQINSLREISQLENKDP